MKKLVGVVLLFVVGCGSGRPWEGEVEAPPHSPNPSDDIMRHPADFRLSDLPQLREYFYYFYTDDPEYSDLRIEAIDYKKPEEEQKPVPLDPDSAEYARAVQFFFASWHTLSPEKKAKYSRDLKEQELRRDATLLDQRIHYKKKAVAELKEEKYLLESDLRSGVAAQVSVKPGRITFLQAEIEKRGRRIRIHEAQLKLLEFRRDLRNVEYSPQGLGLFSTAQLDVSDLLEFYSSPGRLVEDIRIHVRPDAWKRSLVLVEVKNGKLHVRNTAEVIDGVRAYLRQLRVELLDVEPEPLPDPGAPPGESDIVPPRESVPKTDSGT